MSERITRSASISPIFPACRPIREEADVKAFLARSDAEMKSAEGLAMDALGVTKMCCRRHMLTTVDSLEDI